MDKELRIKVDSLPSLLRADICRLLERKLQECTMAARASSDNFVMTLDERQRSVAIQARGEATAYKVLFDIFKERGYLNENS